MVLILLINVFGSTIQPATEVSGPRGQIIRAGPGEGLLYWGLSDKILFKAHEKGRKASKEKNDK